MRRLGVGGTGAVVLVLLGLVAATAASDEDEAQAAPRSSGRNPFSSFFTSGDKKPAAKSDKDKSKKRSTGKDAGTGTPERTGKVDAANAVRELEMAKLLRRQEVCLKLHQIASDTNDDELERLASELDQRAWDVYRERTGGLPGAAAALEEDEKRLERLLPVKSRDTAQLMPPGRKGSPGHDLSHAATVREVEP